MEFYLFDRKEKIIYFDRLGILEPSRKINGSFNTEMSQNEVYTVQIAAVSDCDDIIKSVSSRSDTVKITCINTDITDKFGRSDTRSVKIEKNIIQPLFFILEAKRIGSRNERAEIELECESGKYTLTAEIKITETAVENNGFDDIESLARLKWLNSTLVQDDSLVKPFTKPEIDGDTVHILGRDIELCENGLPKQVYSRFDESISLCSDAQKELFAKPCEFLIGDKKAGGNHFTFQCFNNRIETRSSEETEKYSLEVESVIRYDGQLLYSVKITPKTAFETENISADFYISKDCSSLMHGLGHRASEAQNLDFRWDADKQQDCIYLGSANCGMRVKFKAENYIRPLVNIFYKNLPLNIPDTTWDNHKNGDIKVRVSDGFSKISAETGRFSFTEGHTVSFDFEIHITPFKPLDFKKAFGVRYDHPNNLKDEIKEIDEADKNGLNYVIFHQGNAVMPYINYPFYDTDRLKNAVDYARKKGIGIKLYYTEREHSNHMAETFVYKALGNEIILRKQGVGHSWQKEKPQWLVDVFGEDIIPGWFVKYDDGPYKGQHDFSFIVNPDTRLDNYYIEGLNWLIRNIGISGIYIDDTSLDRTTLERAKKLLDKCDGLIDMHMWNHEEERAGDVSCTNLYCEIMPFLDSIWLGEGFYYKKYSPEYMLAEVSGIPYGLNGQMLEGGGDFYEGMLYAMNNRYGWGHKNAVEMYKLWDGFGIQDSKMFGYWHSKNPIVTDSEDVLTTVYVKDGSALLCVYNFSKHAKRFKFDINTELLGFEPASARKYRFGSKHSPKKNIKKHFILNGRRGMILWLKK